MFHRSGRAKGEKPNRDMPDGSGGDAHEGLALAVAIEDRGSAAADSTTPSMTSGLEGGESSLQVGDAAAAGPSGERVVADNAAPPTGPAEMSLTAETIVMSAEGDGGLAHETAAAEIDSPVLLARRATDHRTEGLQRKRLWSRDDRRGRRACARIAPRSQRPLATSVRFAVRDSSDDRRVVGLRHGSRWPRQRS